MCSASFGGRASGATRVLHTATRMQTGEEPKNNRSSYSANRSRGPNHAVSALTLWAVTWSILCF
jgi:hypothetical protein